MREIVCHIAAHTWAVLQAGRPTANPCLAAARIAQQAARYFGVCLAPRPVNVLVANTVAAELVARGVPVEEWPADAQSSGSDPTRRRPGRYAGHLILAAPDGEATLLVDPSLPAYNLPGLGVELEPLVFDVPGAWPGKSKSPSRQVLDLPGGVVIYEKYDDKGAFRTAPDWAGWSRRYRAEVAMVIRWTRDATTTHPRNG